jgi:hypothetical protein
MKLLVDTDAFCKLGIAGLLLDAALVLGADLHECGRLPALVYMLRRGSLRRRFGAEACDGLISIADPMPIVPAPTAASLDKFTAIEAIDPGEAQIFAAAAEFDLTVISGDKRALRAVKDVDGMPEALSGRISVLEAVLLALCDRLGPEDVRRRIAPLAALDKMVEVCFSPGSSDPREGLLSYYKRLAADLQPLVLWNPMLGDRP